MKGDVWLFGYGSLIWRPSFAFAERRRATLAGWARRFWQGSTDHRGVPGQPGRVVTLVEEAGERCVGVAYRVAAAEAKRVVAELDHRERGGYQRASLALALHGPEAASEGEVWVARRDNPNYLGPAPLDAIAAQVRGAHGPSGANLEYVLQLAEALRGLGAEDAHVFALEQLLRT